MSQSNYRDLTTGPIARKLYRFALPIILTNLMQAIYNIVDMIIVGRFVGAPGIVAVNQGGQIVMIILCVMTSIANAEAALAGLLFGKKDTKGLSGLVHTTLFFSILIGACIVVVILICGGGLLHALDVPAEAYIETKRYLLIYVCGTFFVYIYNVLYGLLRGAGESTAPMVFAFFSTILNLVLDYIFVAIFSWGAGGAAFATIIAQAFSMVMIIFFIKSKKNLFTFRWKEFRMDREWMNRILKIGLPQTIQFTLTNFSFVLINALINSFGVYCAAAAGATNKIWTFGVLPGQAILAALLTFTAQNLANKDYKRIYKALGSGVFLALIISAVIVVAVQIWPEALLGLFTKDPEVMAVGVQFLKIFMFTILAENTMFCFFGVLTGAGHTHVTMLCALTSAFAIRYAFAWVISRGLGFGFHGIAYAYILAPAVAAVIAGIYLISGKWKKPRVKM